jgi:hypothetical protein
LYAVLLAYVARQAYFLWSQGHKLVSFKQAFNSLIVVWASFRVAFWVFSVASPSSENWSVAVFLLFWMPHAIQLCTFSLLALFFIKTIYGEAWAATSDGDVEGFPAWGCFSGLRQASQAVFICVTVVETIFVIAAAVAASQSDEAGTVWGEVEAIGSAAVFAGLSAVFMAVSCRMRSVSAVAYSRMMILKPVVVQRVNVALSVIFASRAVFNVLSATGAITLPVASASAFSDVMVVVVYSVWEILPVSLLLCTLAGGAVEDAPGNSDDGTGGLAALWMLDAGKGLTSLRSGSSDRGLGVDSGSDTTPVGSRGRGGGGRGGGGASGGGGGDGLLVPASSHGGAGGWAAAPGSVASRGSSSRLELSMESGRAARREELAGGGRGHAGGAGVRGAAAAAGGSLLPLGHTGRASLAGSEALGLIGIGGATPGGSDDGRRSFTSGRDTPSSMGPRGGAGAASGEGGLAREWSRQGDGEYDVYGSGGDGVAYDDIYGGSAGVLLGESPAEHDPGLMGEGNRVISVRAATGRHAGSAGWAPSSVG